MERSQLIYVVTVAECGSVTRAQRSCTYHSRRCPIRLFIWSRSLE